jgi:hypothetical protein
MVCLENAVSNNRDGAEANKAHGMLKKMRKFSTLSTLLMMSDVLPKLTALSLVFQGKEVKSYSFLITCNSMRIIICLVCESLRGEAALEAGVQGAAGFKVAW